MHLFALAFSTAALAAPLSLGGLESEYSYGFGSGPTEGIGEKPRKSDKRFVDSFNAPLPAGSLYTRTFTTNASSFEVEVLQGQELVRTVVASQSAGTFTAIVELRAEAEESYSFVIGSTEPKTSLDYRTGWVLQGPRLAAIDADSPFCDKLHYLLVHRTNGNIGFDWMRGPPLPNEDGLAQFSARFAFDNGGTARIRYSEYGLNAYIHQLGAADDLQAATEIFDRHAAAHDTCMEPFGEVNTEAESGRPDGRLRAHWFRFEEAFIHTMVALREQDGRYTLELSVY
jgi:hypothetical protein